jgi:hypothetical protein
MGERKKGKKGKVVDPSLLGFSVTSNWILMREIQHMEVVSLTCHRKPHVLSLDLF